MLLVFVWTDENGRFRTRWCHTSYTPCTSINVCSVRDATVQMYYDRFRVFMSMDESDPNTLRVDAHFSEKLRKRFPFSKVSELIFERRTFKRKWSLFSFNMPWRNQICIATCKCFYGHSDDLPETWTKPLPTNAKSPLPVDERRSQMSLLKLHIVDNSPRCLVNHEVQPWDHWRSQHW